MDYIKDYNKILNDIQTKAVELVEVDYNKSLEYLQNELYKHVKIDIYKELKNLYGKVENILNENGVYSSKEEFKLFIGFMINYAKGYLASEYNQLRS